jgi:hypothetical protein
MLCFDTESAEHITSLKLEHATAIPLATFEHGDEQLTATKSNRTKLEYYYTCGPSLPLYVLKTYPEVSLITYLDADLFFFSNPAPLFDEIEGYSIGITFQNYPEYRPAQATGKYNVGWLSFRRDDNGIRCLEWWREKCIEWCYERFEDGKYADQMYLDEWPQLFHGVKVLENKGANVAPWNLRDYKIYENNGCVMVSGYPLIFFHFHGFKQLTRTIYNTNLGLTFKPPSTLLKESVFKPYIEALSSCSINNNATSSIRVKRLRPKWIQLLRTFARTIIGLIFRQYVFVYKNKIY